MFALFLGKERDYFAENLSMLISGGMPITSALDAIREELRSRRMKSVIANIKIDIESGFPLWRTLARTNLFPEHAVSLIQLGEKSGKLIENLKVVAIEQEKNRVFKSKLRSAMMYPVFVISLTVIIGIGIAWFILPKLATVFAQLKIKLPLITKILIGAGTFLGEYGYYVAPAGILVMAAVFFFIFSFSKTKFAGQYILFSFPGIKDLIKEVEVARFGYLLGTLLEAGIPITQALDSLASATEISPYRKLYIHLRDSVEDGNSIQKSFSTYSAKGGSVSGGKHTSRLIPAPIQQLIVASEQSGTLSRTLLKIGQTFETKADTSTKNLTVILEPILLIIVWLGVVAVALAVILPIYNLIGGFNSGSPEQTTTPPTAETASPAPEAPKSAPEASQKQTQTLRILSTETGYLNVRDDSSFEGKIISKVAPGDALEYTSEKEGWYEIILPDGNSGWVFGQYVEVVKPQ